MRKKIREVVTNLTEYIVRLTSFVIKYQNYISIGVFIFGVFIQKFNNSLLIFLGDEKCIYLKTLMSGLASTIGLSTILVFGFNLTKSVQQSLGKVINDHGLVNLSERYIPQLTVNYWQIFLLFSLYICIIGDWGTLYYILFFYDIFLFLSFFVRIYYIEHLSYSDIICIYKEEPERKQKEFLITVIKNCVDSSQRINSNALRTYVEALCIFLKRYEGNQDKVEEEELYTKALSIFIDTIENLVLDDEKFSILLIAIIREFCRRKSKEISKISFQIELSVMIRYVLDRTKNININIIYRELLGWVDNSLECRYFIAMTRMEFQYMAEHDYGEVFNENLFYLYSLKFSLSKEYENLIKILWYLWSYEDEENGQGILLNVEGLYNFIDLCKRKSMIYNKTDAEGSLYKLVIGLRY